MNPFHFEVMPSEDTTTRIVVSGELDMMAAPRLRQAILDAHDRTGGDVTLDLEQVTFIDSTGLAVLLVTRRLLGQSRARLVLTRVSARVTTLLEITGVGSHFEIESDSAEPPHPVGGPPTNEETTSSGT